VQKKPFRKRKSKVGEVHSTIPFSITFVRLPKEARQFSVSKPIDKAPVVAPCNGVRPGLAKIAAQSDGIARYHELIFSFLGSVWSK